MINSKQISSSTNRNVHVQIHYFRSSGRTIQTIGRLVLLENRYTHQGHGGTIPYILWEHTTVRKPIIQHLPLPDGYDELVLAVAPTISSCFACSILKCYFSIQSLFTVCFSVFPTLSQCQKNHSPKLIALTLFTYTT